MTGFPTYDTILKMIQQKQFSYDSQNELLFFGQGIKNLIQDQMGPTYVYSQKGLTDRLSLYLEMMKSALPQGFQAHYAVKANSHPRLLKFYADHGLGADVVSGGELKKALESVPANKIIFSGVGKTKKEISFAIEQQICQINVESPSELIRIKQIANEMKKKIAVVLRVNPHVDPKTHKYISTGFKENKFGIDEDAVNECLSLVKQDPYVELKGLSCHIGSQLLEFSALKEALQKVKKMYLSLKDQGFALDRLDIGGGLGIHYTEDAGKDVEALSDYCAVLKTELKDFPAKIQSEPGRFLVARSGLLLSQIQYIKDTPYKKFVIVDSGMNHLIRPALYEAHHRIFPVLKRNGPSITADVVGPVCESSDFFAKDREFTELKEGDWIAIVDSGAYGYSMVSLYNSFELPKEVFI